MNFVDISFEDSPLELLVSSAIPGKPLSAAALLAVAEDAGDELQEAFERLTQMGVPLSVAELPKNAGKAMVQRTQIAYMNHQIYQRTDNDEVFMVSPKVEALLASTLLPLSVADKGMFCAAGIASTLFISPADVMQNEMTALHHLAKLKWV